MSINSGGLPFFKQRHTIITPYFNDAFCSNCSSYAQSPASTHKALKVGIERGRSAVISGIFETMHRASA
jgi:hypothetical protein